MKDQPELGFYYHYRYDPAKGIENYAYEVLNIVHHTEIDDFEESTMVAYRPIYKEARVYQAGKHWDVRPLKMFMEDVTKEDKTYPRFTKITDSTIISKLEKVRDDLYK